MGDRADRRGGAVSSRRSARGMLRRHKLAAGVACLAVAMVAAGGAIVTQVLLGLRAARADLEVAQAENERLRTDLEQLRQALARLSGDGAPAASLETPLFALPAAGEVAGGGGEGASSETEELRQALIRSNYWPRAQAAAAELAKLEPEAGWELARSAWGEMGDQAKRLLLQGAVDAGVPCALRVLHLGVTDETIATQNASLKALRGVAFWDFTADYSAYLRWHEGVGDAWLADVQVSEFQRFTADAFSLPTHEFVQAMGDYSVATAIKNQPVIRQIAEEAGMIERLFDIVRQPGATGDAAGKQLTVIPFDDETLKERLLPLLKEGQPADVQARMAMLFSRKKSAYAVELILAALVDAVRQAKGDGPHLAIMNFSWALDDLGDPRPIPTLIGLIDSGAPDRVVRDVESRALRRLAGVKESHDGAWWRAWWQENRKRFDEPLASAEVPAFQFGEKPPQAPAPKPVDTLASVSEEMIAAVIEGKGEGDFYGIAGRMSKLNDPAGIPVMIACIEALDTHAVIYGIGHFGLRGITGVPYDAGHNGAWWRRWWENNRHRYGETVAAMGIPKIELDQQQQAPRAASVSGDVESLTRALVDGVKNGASDGELYRISRRLGELGDVAAVPTLIAGIEASDDARTVSSIRQGLRELTGVTYGQSHDAAWWRTWWLENRHRYGEPYASMDIPTIEMPQSEEVGPPPEDEVEPGVHRFHAGGDTRNTYILNTPREEAPQPAGGWKLLLVLPGGNGSEDFQAFISNIARRGVPQGYIVAQLVAPQWSEQQASELVWPIERSTHDEAEFTTEAFISAVVEDVKGRYPINEKRIFAMGWSSGGPPVYAATAAADSPVRGAFVAMSIFNTQLMGPLEQAAGKPFYILHSPQDAMIPMNAPRAARDQLAAAGAKTKLETYEGGHGWRGDVLGMIRRGVEWLEEQAGQ